MRRQCVQSVASLAAMLQKLPAQTAGQFAASVTSTATNRGARPRAASAVTMNVAPMKCSLEALLRPSQV